MSGGCNEYMASYMENTIGESGFKIDPVSTYGEKYFDIYPSTNYVRTYNNRILGDATGEMGPFYHYADTDGIYRNHNKWYNYNSDFLNI